MVESNQIATFTQVVAYGNFGLGFINVSHFDSFWTKCELFKQDRLHPNRKGSKQLVILLTLLLLALIDGFLSKTLSQYPGSVFHGLVHDCVGPH